MPINNDKQLDKALEIALGLPSSELAAGTLRYIIGEGKSELEKRRFDTLEFLYCLSLVSLVSEVQAETKANKKDERVKFTREEKQTIKDEWLKDAEDKIRRHSAYIASSTLASFLNQSMYKEAWDEKSLIDLAQASSFAGEGSRFEGKLGKWLKLFKLKTSLPELTKWAKAQEEKAKPAS